ncbi:class F sortase [Streptomyces sp. ISL-1]|uniref:class F sortase n=1 Tax=Streptomyces sp. ISL-1 TaxID=2817657 RepID=UPI001BECE7C1|nr:class F sortase [Streptomyces sp. ISL-1]MBT2388652.1 class F sortase [Streptomyces sp. ISL-1]
MTAQQPPGSALASRPLGRVLLWPALAVVLGFFLIYNFFGASVELKPPARAAASAPAAPPGAAAPADELVLPRSVPKRIAISEIAVDAPFTALSIGSSGQLNAPPPDDNNLVGWFEGGVTPGERGTSVVAGHVDTKTGPAVFLQLSLLKPGSTVDITREDGTVATFKVDSVETFSKAHFPNERVYADTPSPQLRLITCGGDYDRKAMDYTDNVVVFAHLDSVKRA